MVKGKSRSRRAVLKVLKRSEENVMVTCTRVVAIERERHEQIQDILEKDTNL